MSPGPRRTAFALFAVFVTCLVVALLIGTPSPALERDTGPTIASLELVSHPAALVLPVAIAPTAVLAEAHETVSESATTTLNYELHAPILIARYESARSELGRRAATYDSVPNLQAILDAHRPRSSNPRRC